MSELLNERLRDLDGRLRVLRERAKAYQNEDGGFKGFYSTDSISGVWTTAEIVHNVAKTIRGDDDAWLRRGCDYLLATQNPDGGWPFRAGGKSIVDITAWCCLALHHFGHPEALARGLTFLLDSRTSSGGWGLTRGEQERVYSTWIGTYCLSRIARHAEEAGLALQLPPERIEGALAEATKWLLAQQNADGSWSPVAGGAPHRTATAVALLALFQQGHDPTKFRPSYQFLVSGLMNGVWQAENEIVVTKEGYELTQEWFTGALCFRALIFFAEMGVATIPEIDRVAESFFALVHLDGTVSVVPGGSTTLVWSVPYMMDAIGKYSAFIRSEERGFASYLEHRDEERRREKRRSIETQLETAFPHPISRAFTAFQREPDLARRYELLLEVYEVTIEYAAIVALAGYLSGRERDAGVNALLLERFRAPALGDWASLLERLLQVSKRFERLADPTTGHELLSAKLPYLDPRGTLTSLHDLLAGIVELRSASSTRRASRSLYEHKLLVEQEQGRLYSLLDRFAFLGRSNFFLVLASGDEELGDFDHYKVRVFRGLQIVDEEIETSSRLSAGQRDSTARYVYFQNARTSTVVNLYPFVSHMRCDECREEGFFFYDGARPSDLTSYRSYQCGHRVERPNGAHFRKRFSASDIDW